MPCCRSLSKRHDISHSRNRCRSRGRRKGGPELPPAVIAPREHTAIRADRSAVLPCCGKTFCAEPRHDHCGRTIYICSVSEFGKLVISPCGCFTTDNHNGVACGTQKRRVVGVEAQLVDTRTSGFGYDKRILP